MENCKGYRGWTMIDGEQGLVTLKNALHNLSSTENGNGDEHEYSKGVLVGVVSVLMANGLDFDKACQLCWQCMPTDCHPDRIPESWKDEFHSRIAKSVEA